jgi:hypothetical protein
VRTTRNTAIVACRTTTRPIWRWSAGRGINARSATNWHPSAWPSSTLWGTIGPPNDNDETNKNKNQKNHHNDKLHNKSLGKGTVQNTVPTPHPRTKRQETNSCLFTCLKINKVCGGAIFILACMSSSWEQTSFWWKNELARVYIFWSVRVGICVCVGSCVGSCIECCSLSTLNCCYCCCRDCGVVVVVVVIAH